MLKYMVRTSARPRPMPVGHWSMTQRWNDLLFAHWPMPAQSVAPLLPAGLQIDTYNGSAWVGVTPFQVDRIKLRGLPTVARGLSYPELSLRTYVRDEVLGTRGIYDFTTDCGSLLAVSTARLAYHMPYHWAQMELVERGEREFAFYSSRYLSRKTVRFRARYRGLGPTRRLAELGPGSLEFFLLERSCYFRTNGQGQAVRTNVHAVSWPLEDAQADIEQNDLPMSIGLCLPNQPPVLHYVRRLALYIWPAELVTSARAQSTPQVAVSPS